MTISNQTSRITYTGNGVVTDFPVPFYFRTDSDLDVYADAVLQGLGSAYTATGAGVSSGGTVVFATAPANDVSIVIYRDPPLTQTTDYIESDAFPAASHEAALDKAVTIDQRTRDMVSRSLRLRDYDPTVEMLLPLEDDRADRVLGFNSSGVPVAVANVPVGSVAFTAFGEAWVELADAAAGRAYLDVDGSTTSASSIPAAEATSYGASVDAIRVDGYAAAGDGGGAIYKRVVAEPAHAGKFQSADGTWWEITGNEISVCARGAKFDGATGDSAAITSAMAVADALSIGVVTMPGGTAIVNANITGYPGIHLRGAGMGLTTLKAHASLTGHMVAFASCDDSRASDFTCDINEVAGVVSGLVFQNSDRVAMDRVQAKKLKQFGLAIQNCDTFRVADCVTDMTTAAGTQNEGILVTGTNTNGLIDNNVLLRSGMDITANRTTISNNKITGWKFGGGITVEQDATCYELLIDGNVCIDGTGTDVNGTVVPGIECWSKWSICTNNLCATNAGTGIDWGGFQSLVANNICINNSQLSSNAANGIVARYSVSYSASETIFANNKSFNTSGLTGPQKYGYSEESSSLINVTLTGNDFGINHTGPTEIKSNTTRLAMIGRAPPTVRTAATLICDDYTGSEIFNGSGTITVTLPAPASSRGKELKFKTIAAQTVVSASSNVKPISTDTDGTAILPGTAGAWCVLQSDGTSWVVMARGT